MKKTIRLVEDFEMEDVFIAEIEESDIKKLKKELDALRERSRESDEIEDEYCYDNIKPIIKKYCSELKEIAEIPVIYF